MFKYILQRVLISIPLLIGITLIIFVMADAMPGDAVLAMQSDESFSSEELIELRREQLGLSDPLYIQYLRWVGQLLQGNLGRSYITSESIGEQIKLRIRPTLELMGAALSFSIIVGVTLGIISALKQYSYVDYLLTLGGFAGISIPVFFLALILIYIFALRLGWLPASGYATAGEPPTFIDRLRHILLPAISLGLLRTAMFMRYTRAAVLEVINQDYIRTAHAKGLKDVTIILKHVVRSSLLPLITVIGLTLPVLFAGAVIIEQIFQWPGIGLLFIVAIEARDGPQIMGIALISAVIVLTSNLLTDIAYAWIDPRIRYD